MPTLDSNEEQCSLDGCESKRYCKGYCSIHYHRKLRTGDPNKVLKVVGENRMKHPLYGIYMNMKDRCYNQKSKFYYRYGDRGVKICDRWLGTDGFTHFVSDMGSRPEGYSIDRIDNNRGYSPDNCRWADKYTQQQNKNFPLGSSGIRGVVYQKETGKWLARIERNGVKLHLGSFDTKDDAAAARKTAEASLNQPTKERE